MAYPTGWFCWRVLLLLLLLPLPDLDLDCCFSVPLAVGVGVAVAVVVDVDDEGDGEAVEEGDDEEAEAAEAGVEVEVEGAAGVETEAEAEGELVPLGLVTAAVVEVAVGAEAAIPAYERGLGADFSEDFSAAAAGLLSEEEVDFSVAAEEEVVGLSVFSVACFLPRC